MNNPSIVTKYYLPVKCQRANNVCFAQQILMTFFRRAKFSRSVVSFTCQDYCGKFVPKTDHNKVFGDKIVHATVDLNKNLQKKYEAWARVTINRPVTSRFDERVH